MNKDIIITQYDYVRLHDLLNKYAAANKNSATAKNLMSELTRAKRVDSKEIPADYVTMNSVIELKDLDEPGKLKFRLVFPNDADMEKGKMSVLAPVGTAVLGYREGDVVKWNVPAGGKKFRINKVIYQPEAAGDYHL